MLDDLEAYDLLCADPSWKQFTQEDPSWLAIEKGGVCRNENLAGFSEGMIDFAEGILL